MGGADAQNFFVALLASLASVQCSNPVSMSNVWQKFIARDKNRDSIQKLLEKTAEIHLYAYNGAGIRHSTAELAKIAAEQLKTTKMIVTVNHQRVHHDAVNTVGQTTLHDFKMDSDSSDTGKVLVHSLFFNGREEFTERVKTAHTDRQFFSKTIGGYHFYKGKVAQSELKLKIESLGGKIEPDALEFNQLKQMLQKGDIASGQLMPKI